MWACMLRYLPERFHNEAWQAVCRKDFRTQLYFMGQMLWHFTHTFPPEKQAAMMQEKATAVAHFMTAVTHSNPSKNDIPVLHQLRRILASMTLADVLFVTTQTMIKDAERSTHQDMLDTAYEEVESSFCIL